MTRRYGVYGKKLNRASVFAGDADGPRSKHEARFGAIPMPVPAPGPGPQPNPGPQANNDGPNFQAILNGLGYTLGDPIAPKHVLHHKRVRRFQRDYNMMLKCGALLKFKKGEHIHLSGEIDKPTAHAIIVAKKYDNMMPRPWMHYVKKCHHLMNKD